MLLVMLLVLLFFRGFLGLSLLLSLFREFLDLGLLLSLLDVLLGILLKLGETLGTTEVVGLPLVSVFAAFGLLYRGHLRPHHGTN